MRCNDFFYDKTLYCIEQEISIDEIGEEFKQCFIGAEFKGDIQPVNDSVARKTWGEDTQCSYSLYTGEDLETGSLIMYENTVFQIDKKTKWETYIFYGLIETSNEFEVA